MTGTASATTPPHRRGGARWLAVTAIAILSLGLSACLGLGTPPADSTATPGSGGSGAPSAADSVLDEAIDGLARARSFGFQAASIHTWYEGTEKRDWVFVGNGAYQAPDQFYSRMEGPADVDLRLTVRGSAILAADSKGPVANPSLAFGGPGNGASPFTVIAYLRNQQAGAASAFSLATLDNQAVYRIAWRPNLASVAALDLGQRQSMARVLSVEGLVWVDRNTKQIKQQQVTVDSTTPSGAPTSVQTTLRFTTIDRPVDIQNP